MFAGISETYLDQLIDKSERVFLRLPSTLPSCNSYDHFWLIIQGGVTLSMPGLFGQICELVPGEVVGLIEASQSEPLTFNAKSSANSTVLYKVSFSVKILIIKGI